jgi:hypothetical protein
MKRKHLIILGVAAAVVAVFAAISLSRFDSSITAGDASTTGDGAKNRLFPGLLDHVNDVQTVKLQQKDGETTLQKNGDHWGVVEKGGYPIEMEPVRKMLIAMGEMTKLEKKTADASRYDQLGLQDPTAEGSKSALITLQDASSKDMAKLVLGKERESKGSAVSNQRYVRIPGDPQTWLVQGTFDVKEKASDWLEKKIVEVKRDRIRSVEITQPDGSLLAVDRPDAKTNDYTLVDIPEGKELTYPTAAGSHAGGLEYVNLEDVQPVDKVDFTANPGPTAKFKTFDGLVITVATKDLDNNTWAKFTASYEAPPAPPAPASTDASKPADASATPDASAATDAAKAADSANAADAEKKPDEAKKPDTAAADAANKAAEVEKEVADLNDRLSKWAFQLSTYTAANLKKKKSDLLKDKAPPPSPADPNAPKDAHGGGTVKLPDSIPPEIQEQIKAHQESLGNKVETSTPKPEAQTPQPGGDGPAPTPTSKPDEKPAPKPDEKPAEPPH